MQRKIKIKYMWHSFVYLYIFNTTMVTTHNKILEKKDNAWGDKGRVCDTSYVWINWGI